MTPAPVHYLRETERFLRCCVGFSRTDGEQVGSHHATVEPMNRAASSDAAHHADVRPVDFGNNVADEILRQSCCIRDSLNRRFPSHSNVLPARVGAKCAQGKTCTGCGAYTSELWSLSGTTASTRSNTDTLSVPGTERLFRYETRNATVAGVA